MENIPDNAYAEKFSTDNPSTFSKSEQLKNISLHPYGPIPDKLRFSTVLMPLPENASLQPYYPSEIGVEGSSTDDKLLQPLKALSSP